MSDLIVWTPGVKLDDIERQVICKAYAWFRENKTATAQALGISIRTLDAKFEKYDAEERRMVEQAEIDRKKADNFQARSRGLPPPYPEVMVLEASPASSSDGYDIPVVERPTSEKKRR